MGYSRSEMASKALGSFAPSELLLSIASTLLVVYLSLGYLVYTTRICCKEEMSLFT